MIYHPVIRITGPYIAYIKEQNKETAASKAADYVLLFFRPAIDICSFSDAVEEP